MFRIIPESAHSAYDKAAQYFNIKLWRVPVNKEFEADVKAIRKFINRNTILVSTYFDSSLVLVSTETLFFYNSFASFYPQFCIYCPIFLGIFPPKFH